MSSERRDFLLQMYKTYWDIIARTDESLWKFLGTYALLLGTSALALEKGLIPKGIAVTMMILFGFLAILMVLNKNDWFVRNMGLISNLEQEFLDDADYNVLVPSFFKDKQNFLNWEIYCLQIGAYLVVNIIIFFSYLINSSEPCSWKIFVSIFFLVCLAIFRYSWHITNKNYIDFKEKAKGKKKCVEK